MHDCMQCIMTSRADPCVCRQIWNVHSVLNVLHSLVDKSNINRQLDVYTNGGEYDMSV